MKRILFLVVAINFLGIVFLNPAGANELDSVVREALVKNHAVKKAISDVKIAEATVEKTYAMFDVKLDSNVTYSNAKSKSNLKANSVLAPVETEVLGYSASLSEKILTGGYLSLGYNTSRTYFGEYPGYEYNPGYAPELTLSYSQPLLKDFWGRPDRTAIRIGDISIALSQESLKNTIINHAEELLSSYYLVIMAKRMLAVQEAALREAQEYYRQAQRMQAIGLREKKDLLQTKASMLDAQANIGPAENNLQAAVDQFLTLSQMSEETWQTVSRSFTDTIPQLSVPEKLNEDEMTRMIDQQPLIVASKLTLEIQQLNQKIKQTDSLPALSVFGSYGITGLNSTMEESFSEMLSNEYHNYAVGINFSMFLPDRNSSGNIKTATEELAKSTEDFENMKKALRLQIREVHRTILNARNDYALKQQVRELQEQNLAIQNRHFTQGRIATQELLQAQQSYHGAQFSEITAYYTYCKAVNSWQKLTGGFNQYVTESTKELSHGIY